MCSKMPGGVWDGVLGRGSSLGKGSGIRVQCVCDVATKRTHGLRWMGERRLSLIWAVQGQLASIWTPGCLPTQTSPRLPLRERESELEGISSVHFLLTLLQCYS